MYCIHCGKEIADDAAFCIHCGGKQPQSVAVPPPLSDAEENTQQVPPESEPSPPMPEKNASHSKVGVFRWAYRIFAFVLTVVILGGIFYTEFLEKQRNLPAAAPFFTVDNIKQIPSYTVLEFSRELTSDDMDDDWIRLTEIYYYADVDYDNNTSLVVGTDRETVVPVRFYNVENMNTFLLAIETIDTMQIFGRCRYDEASETLYLNEAMVLNNDFTLMMPDALAEAAGNGSAPDTVQQSTNGGDLFQEFFDNPVAFERNHGGESLTITGVSLASIDDDYTMSYLYPAGYRDMVFLYCEEVDPSVIYTLSMNETYTITGVLESVTSNTISLVNCTFVQE